MGVLITNEMIVEAGAGESAFESIARAFRWVRDAINSLYTIPDAAPLKGVFIDQPFVKGHHFEREISGEIVCGNCAGAEERPRRTLLVRDPITQASRCASCGGRSYVLASRCYRRKQGE